MMKHLKETFAVLLLVCATSVVAQDFEAGGLKYRILSQEDKTVEVARPTNWQTIINVTIPESVSNNGVAYSVESIGNGAFAACPQLYIVEIGNNIKSIGERAFQRSGIYQIKIPDSVTTLGAGAFNDCQRLMGIEIGSAVQNIGEGTFSYCTNLQVVHIGRSVQSIGNEAFAYCSNLQKISIGRSVKTLGDYVFLECNKVNSVINLTDLDLSGYFPAGCYYVNVPNGSLDGDFIFTVTDEAKTLVKYLGTFYSYTLPSNCEGDNYIIGSDVFQNNTNIVNMIIPEGVSGIEDNAFNGCSNISSITIPGSMRSIGNDAFNGCSALSQVNISDISAWCGIEFEHENSNPLYYAEKMYLNGNLLTELVIPDDVTAIKNYAFYNCKSLTSVEVPNSVKSIGDYAFSYSTSLTNIEIGNNVTSIGDYAFYNCTALENINIPNSVKSIGANAFYECAKIENIEIAGVESIGNRAFRGCTALKSIEIPDGVTSIGEGVFSYCKGLTAIKLPGTLKSIGRDAFNQCLVLGNIEIPNNVTSIGSYAFQYCNGFTSIVIPNSVTSLGDRAFQNCSNLTEVSISNNLTIIPENAFYGCTALVNVTIPNSVETIRQSAFELCSNLRSVTIGSGVEYIGQYAFSNCYNLVEVISLARTAPRLNNAFAFTSENKTLYYIYEYRDYYINDSDWKNCFARMEAIPPTGIPITINQYGSGTFCSDYALDFSEVPGLKAYVASGYKPSTGVVTLVRVESIPGGTGLFVKGTPGETYTVPVIETSDDYFLNMLAGTLESTAVYPTDGEYTNYKYTVNTGDTTPKFYQIAAETYFQAGKAYLQIPTAWVSSASKSIAIRYDDGETTGIDEVENENIADNAIYDLQGRKVDNPSSGIYIVNGKKIFIK